MPLRKGSCLITSHRAWHPAREAPFIPQDAHHLTVYEGLEGHSHWDIKDVPLVAWLPRNFWFLCSLTFCLCQIFMTQKPLRKHFKKKQNTKKKTFITEEGIQGLSVLIIIIWLFLELFLLQLAKPRLDIGCEAKNK